MKNIITFLLLGCLLSCQPETDFTGYIVAKEYTPAHMSNETPTTYSFQPIFVPPPPRPAPPSKVESCWVWFIANKYSTIEKYVDSLTFHTKNCGDKVTVKY